MSDDLNVAGPVSATAAFEGASGAHSMPKPVTITTFSPRDNWSAFAQAISLVAQTVASPSDGPLVGLLDPGLPALRSARMTIARVGSNLAGCVYTKLDDDGTRGWVGGLVVSSDYRGYGLAKTLVCAAVKDRWAVDGYGLPLAAYVRVFGKVNEPSRKAFCAAGFVASAPRQVPVTELQSIAPHFEASSDGLGQVTLLLLTHGGMALSESQLALLTGP